jgi:hypothetical protein
MKRKEGKKTGGGKGGGSVDGEEITITFSLLHLVALVRSLPAVRLISVRRT